MESNRFDALTKQLATAGTSRRRLLRALGGVVAGAVATGVATRTAGAAPDCSQCGFACPTPNCPWTCCGLREEKHALQEEERVIHEEAHAIQSAPDVSCKPNHSLCQANAQCCSGHCFNKQVCMAPR